MTDYDVVGVSLSDPWQYDYVKEWMTPEKQITAVKKIISMSPGVPIGFDLPIRTIHLWCDPDEISGVIQTGRDVLSSAVRIRYDKNTLDYLSNLPSDVIERLVQTAASGIQSGLEKTLEKQEEFKQGKKHKDGGAVFSFILSSIAERLHNDAQIKTQFTPKQINHMVYYIANGFLIEIGYDKI